MEEDRLCNPSYKTRKIVLILVGVVWLLLTSCSNQIIRVSKKSPLTYREHLRLATIYEAQGAFDAALKEYRAALKLNPKSAQAHFGMGNVYLKSRNHHEAERHYLKAIELDPTKGVFYNNLGWVYIETGRYTDAYVTISRGLTLDAERDYIYLDSLGIIEMRRGNLKQAELLLKDAALRTPPENILGRLRIEEHLLELYTLMKDENKASQSRRKIESLKRGIPVVP